MSVNCLRCSVQFERQRVSEHFCRTCAEARAREIRKLRGRERYELGKELVDEYRKANPEWVADISEERLEEIGLATEHGDASLVLDKMPDGANSPAGPEEGRSTYFRDLADELDLLCYEAAHHEWWPANPHVFFAVHDPAKAAVYNLGMGPKCGAQKGTPAGYMRHYRAGEMACPACAEAKNAKSREDRAA